ncbi:MAG TPA: YezD family protein [Bacillus sp. (in: firmicutes)]|nr:YezD family protein [Bacillus sp. (in: firmicutes)]
MAIVDQEKVDYILTLLKNIEYGSLLITIHDGQITQIDHTEKNRFAITKKQTAGKK